MSSIERTENGYIVKSQPEKYMPGVFGSFFNRRAEQPFPLLSILFPRLFAIISMIFGFRTSTYHRPRTRITEIIRSDDGWRILEYEQ